MKMKFFPAALLWLVVAAAALSTQNAPSPTAPSSTPARATLSGVVIKEPGSEPLKKALIELIAESPSDGANYTALSGTDGGFRIENIVPGSYRLFVERTGYQEVDKHHRRAEGRALTFAAGQEIKDLAIRLQAAAVIEGRVTDEDGDPMPEAQVAVHRQTFVAGRSRWEQVGAERTNDLGEYRIAGLAAGQYFISVTPPPDFKSLIETAGNAHRDGGASSDKPAALAYQTVYYPGTRDRGQASLISLHAGDDFPANFSLAPGPSLTIRGSVVNLPAGATAAILLQSRDFNLVLNGSEMHKDGSFEIRDISPGAYTIVASVDNAAVPMTARQSLQIADSVDGVRLAPQPGAWIRGRIRVESSAAVQSYSAQIFLLLRPVGDENDSLNAVGVGFSEVAHVSPDGSFEWKDIPPGQYSVQISDASATPDWFLRSVVVGGRGVVESGLTVNSGTITLDLTASDNGASAEGVALNSKAEAESVADAIVVAVPEARFRGHLDRYRKAVTDQSGHFRLRGLAPGDYTIFAWESVEGEAYYNPDFVKAYEGQGKALHLSEGEHARLQLKTIPESDDQ